MRWQLRLARWSLEGRILREVRLLATAVAVWVFLCFWVALLSYVAASIAAPLLERRADRRWAETLAPLSTVPEEFPARSANATALELEVIAAQMGIDLATRGFPGRPRPGEEAAEAFNEVHPEVFEYLRGIVGRDAEGLPAPPLRVAWFLGSHAASINRAARLLLEDEEPRWERDLTAYPTVLQNLLGFVHLHRVLLARAAEHANSGDTASAADFLEASWRLNTAAIDENEMISYRLHVEVLTIQIGVLRGMREPAPAWRLRLRDLMLETRTLRAIRCEAWSAVNTARTSELISRWVDPLFRPFARVSQIDLIEAYRQAAAELPGQDMSTFCGYRFDAEQRGRLARHNLVARIGYIPVGTSWAQSVCTALDAELTGRVLDAREGSYIGAPWESSNEDRIDPSRIRGYSWLTSIEGSRLTISVHPQPTCRYPPWVSPLRFSLDIGKAEADAGDR